MSEYDSQVRPTSARVQDIYVQRGTGNENLKKYVVQGDTTVAQLKQMIAEKEGDCSVEDMELVWGGRQLDDKDTINKNQLQDGTQVKLVLRVVNRGQEIYVQRGTGNENLKKYVVQGDTTVAQLKQMIAEKEGDCSVKDMELVWGGRQLDDKDTINENQLQDGTQVKLVLRVVNRGQDIYVQRGTGNENLKKYVVQGDTTIAELKRMIAEKEGDSSVENMQLVWGGRKLDNKSTIMENKLQQGTQVKLMHSKCVMCALL